MSKVAEVVTFIRKEPFIAIEFVFAIALVLDGVYLLLPSYTPLAGSVLLSFAAAPLVADGVAVLYILTGLVTLWGVLTNAHWIRNISTLMLFSCFFFTVLIRLLTVGLQPTLWVWPLLLTFVAVIDNWNINWKRS